MTAEGGGMDEKRTERICTYVGERLMLDLARKAAVKEISLSEHVFRILRRDTYGECGVPAPCRQQET